jgi:small-conductance mechanosensitive channel
VTVGELELSVGSVIGAMVILALTFPIARLTQFVLTKEVLPRFPLPVGVDQTIVAIANYTVIVFGVLMSASAAGLTGTQLTVVFGALSVGIGFGMQSVVNNFVSGLILMFERPIKVGDKIEASGRLGIVTQIGMRASTIRTFEGAEVVIPNGDLISKEVVNWTLSDQKRRVDVAVQVMEGTDVHQAIRALIGAAARHPDVLPEPAPVALLTGLGEGCLNLELRSWTEKSPVTVSSDLHIHVNEALREAGIRTAIPQRDLHLKSVSPGSALVVDGIQAPEKRS